MTLPERLTQMRKDAGLSQQALAEQIYVTRQAVSQWENGDRVPNSDNLMYLSKLYGVSVDYLLHGDAAQEQQAQTEKAPVAVQTIPPQQAEPEAVKQPARFRVRWWMVLVALVTCAAIVAAAFVYRADRVKRSQSPVEGLVGEEVVIPPGNTFSFD